jgi:predicted O-methyltransferase YrrM
VYTFLGCFLALDANPIVNSPFLVSLAGLIGALLALRIDLRRRSLSFARIFARGLLSFLDIASAAPLAGGAAALLAAAIRDDILPLNSPLTWGSIACVAIFVFVWSEGRRQIQFQRPAGIVFCESLILVGAVLISEALVFRRAPAAPYGFIALGVAAIVSGAAVIGVIVPPFVKRYEGLRILERLEQQGETVQPEYVPPTAECPHPERWKMLDSQTSELEVLEFLKSIVMTVKPELIVETGTFLGYSAIKMAEGLRANGFGKLITIEHDAAIFAKAKERIDASGLGNWIEYRNASSLETQIAGTIDVFFSDSYMKTRDQEIRRFLPQLNPQGLLLVHDASSHFGVVRDAVLQMEAEGLISTVLLSTPRGMVVAQKRAGRR